MRSLSYENTGTSCNFGHWGNVDKVDMFLYYKVERRIVDGKNKLQKRVRISCQMLARIVTQKTLTSGSTK